MYAWRLWAFCAVFCCVVWFGISTLLSSYNNYVVQRLDLPAPLVIGENEKPLCPLVSLSWVHDKDQLSEGEHYKPNLANVTWEEVIHQHRKVQLGGSFVPETCTSGYKMAMIIAYRDREEHLKVFLRNMHQLLRIQQVEYTIFVVNQTDDQLFNKGMLMNAGALEVEKIGNYDCIIYHDVDLIPENSRIQYRCSPWPIHMATSVEKFNFKKPPIFDFAGGVLNVPKDILYYINGHSNSFWGWGGEDDDIYDRFIDAGLHVMRYPLGVGRYRTLPHPQAKANPSRYEVLKKEGSKKHTDGLSDVKYHVIQTRLHGLYTVFDIKLEPNAFYEVSKVPSQT